MSIRSSARVLIVLLCCSLVAVLGLFVLLGDSQPPTQPRAAGDSRKPDDRAAEMLVDIEPAAKGKPATAQATANAAPASTNVTVMLPDASLPLSEQWPALEALAAGGNGEAICRLTVELQRCASDLRRRRFQQLMQNSVANGNSRRHEDRFVDLIARDQETHAETEAHCAGIDDEQVNDSMRLLRSGAANLTPRQKTLLALMRPDGVVERLPRTQQDVVPMQLDSGFVVPQFLADNAYGFLEQGIAAGDPLALEGMMIVHSPSWLPGLIRGARLALPDPRRFLYYSTVMSLLFGEESLGQFASETRQNVLSMLSAEEAGPLLRRAEQEARRWRQLPAGGLVKPPGFGMPSPQEACSSS